MDNQCNLCLNTSLPQVIQSSQLIDGCVGNATHEPGSKPWRLPVSIDVILSYPISINAFGTKCKRYQKVPTGTKWECRSNTSRTSAVSNSTRLHSKKHMCHLSSLVRHFASDAHRLFIRHNHKNNFPLCSLMLFSSTHT